MFRLLPFLLSLLLMGLAARPGTAQVQYATLVTSSNGIVTEGAKAADGALATSAVIKPTPVLGYTSLRVRFPAAAAVGQPAGMYIKPNALISAALLGGATINTYATADPTPQESYTLSNSLVGVSTQPSGITQITFLPAQAFQEIELVFFSTVALGQDIAVYEAYSTVAPLPLPVVLAGFRAQATPTGVALAWQTASERNADYFVVERADSLTAEFRALGRVACGGTSTQARHYQFMDAAPLPLGYYRLRQVDLDGVVTFGPVVTSRARLPEAGLAAYPSPATASLTVVGATGPELEVRDQLGRLLLRSATTAAPAQQLGVQSLPSGTYFVLDTKTGQRLKFVKTSAP